MISVALVDMLADYISGLQWFTDPKNRDKALEVISSVTKAPKQEFSEWVFVATSGGGWTVAGTAPLDFFDTSGRIPWPR